MNRRQKIIVSVTGIFIVLLILIGLTYAYFLTRITGNGNPTSISVTTANLELVYGDGTTAILTSETPIEPGKFTASKDFTVTNNGNVLTDYAVTLEDFAVFYANDTVIDGVSVKAGTVTKMEYPSDMKMTITCVIESDDATRNGKSCTNQIIDGTLPTENSILLTNSIEVDDTHNYVLTLTYEDSGIDQSKDMNKTIRGKIDIIDPKSTIDLTGTVANYQSGDYLEINSTPIKSEIVDGKYKIIGVEPGSHTLYIKYKDANGNVQTRGSQSLTIKKGTEASVSGSTITFADSSREAIIDIGNDYELIINDEIKDYKYFYDNIIKSIAHRGYSLVAPENTIPAYELAKKQGFNYVETDVAFTKDDIPVLSHDGTINRVARNTDGSELSETIYIKDVTYSELLNYDFGIYKGSKYAGTKITTLEEFIVFCKNNNLKPYIEIKYGTSNEQVKIILNMVKNYGIEKDVTYITVGSIAYIIKVNDKEARIGLLSNYAEINNELISDTKSFETGENEVFIDFDYTLVNSNGIKLCKDANIPLEVYTVNDSAVIKNLDPYISGVTSEWLIAGKIKYENSLNSKPQSPYLQDYEVVKVLNSSDINYNTNTSYSYPYSKYSPARASYVNFDIILEDGYIYKFEFDSSVDTARMGVHFIDEFNLRKVELSSDTISYKDSGWQESGYTKEISYSSNGSTYKVVRLVFCMTSENDSTPVEDGFINSVIISRKSIN